MEILPNNQPTSTVTWARMSCCHRPQTAGRLLISTSVLLLTVYLDVLCSPLGRQSCRGGGEGEEGRDEAPPQGGHHPLAAGPAHRRGDRRRHLLALPRPGLRQLPRHAARRARDRQGRARRRVDQREEGAGRPGPRGAGAMGGRTE